MLGTMDTTSALDRREALPELIGDPTEFLIVAGLAGAAKDVGAHTSESSNTFLFGGAMAGATMTGLGLALAQPRRRVLVVTGDGDLLMSLGSLATIGVMQPTNLAIICVDNELYGETGNQFTHTQAGVDLGAVARGCGITIVHHVKVSDEMPAAAAALRARAGPVFVLLKAHGGPPPAYSRNWHAEETKTAFRRSLLGTR
jgi:thiamine pyrophosphate-dependent acetolactate synthase large subunit-like protein